MLASKREKNIAIATVSAIALFVVWAYFVQPYLTNLQQIRDDTAKARQDLADGRKMINAQVSLQKTMNEMRSHGLKDDESQADTQLDYAMVQWSQLSGVEGPPELRREAPAKAGIFPIIGYTVQVAGTSKAMSRVMWALETATLPIRISSMTVTPQREGTDNLTIHLEVSTLSMPPSDTTPAKTAVKATQASPGLVLPNNAIMRTTQASPATQSLAATRPANGGTSR